MIKRENIFLMFVLTILFSSSVNATILQRVGWNLVSVCEEMNTSAINVDGVDEIQSQDGEIFYSGALNASSTLKKLEAGYAYWVKSNKSEVDFNSGKSSNNLEKPLKYEGWNMMASCEDILVKDINMSSINEIQNQGGESVYTGELAIASNLDVLASGYGHWINGSKGLMFSSQRTSISTTTQTTLMIPPLASFSMVDGYKVFQMDINKSTTEFFKGIQTDTYGINSNVLGETIRLANRDKVKIVYHNNLDESTTIHGHGMHVPAIMDGGPTNKILAHTSWTTTYTVNQKACTNWYHPHLMGKTAEHVYMGLAGLMIIDDNESDILDLPKEYGVDDIPLILQDKRFDAQGQIEYAPTRMEIRRGYLSDIMLANGVIDAILEVSAKKIRFRVLNGSNARVYNLAFSDNRNFYQIATDNAFLEAPVSLSSLVLTPGERAEIVVDFKNDLNKDIFLKDINSNLDIMKIMVTKVAKKDTLLPTHLTTHHKLNPTEAVRTRQFQLGMTGGHMSINGKTMDMMRIDEVVPMDEVEIWEITNNMGMDHNFHIHSTHFYPLERDGSSANILVNERGYKDTIHMLPNSSVKIIVKMTDFPDDNTGYMYHCHFLEHEDDGMMGQFTITTGDAVINVGGTTGRQNGPGGRNGRSN